MPSELGFCASTSPRHLARQIALGACPCNEPTQFRRPFQSSKRGPFDAVIFLFAAVRSPHGAVGWDERTAPDRSSTDTSGKASALQCCAARFRLAFSDQSAEIQCEECIPPPSVEFSCLNRQDRLPFLPPGAEVKSLHRVSCSHFVAQSDFLDVNSVRMSLPS